jgi:hypothetical protein
MQVMAQDEITIHSDKISREFQTRLDNLKPEQTIRAILLSQVDTDRQEKRLTRTERQEKATAIRAAAEKTLPEIDTILDKHEGKRLADKPNALGAIPVETTRAGLAALADSLHVRAILEDQRISLLSPV